MSCRDMKSKEWIFYTHFPTWMVYRNSLPNLFNFKHLTLPRVVYHA